MSVYIWGFGKLGQLGTGDVKGRLVPTEVKLPVGNRPAQICTGGLFTAVITTKGDLGKYGRLGTGNEDDIVTLTKVTLARDTKVASVSAGSWHTCAITYLGRLYSWGYNSRHNVLGRPSQAKCCSTPAIIPSLLSIPVKTVSCGHNFTLLSTGDGQVFSWGSGKYGVLGLGSERCATVPTRIDYLSHTAIRAIHAGYAHCAVVADNGSLFTFGKGSDGALGHGNDLSNCLKPTLVAQLAIEDIVDVSCSVGEHRGHTLALTAQGCVYAWGSNYRGKLGLGDFEPRLSPTLISQKSFSDQEVTQISAGGVHSGAITSGGNVFTWGCGKDGRLGHPDVEAQQHSYYSAVPKIVSRLPKDKKAVKISCSHYHTAVIMETPLVL